MNREGIIEYGKRTWHWVIAALVLLFVVAIPVYVVSSLAYDTAVTHAHQERLIMTVSTVLTKPTGYAGVKLNVAYYYKKDEYRVRVVATLPNGYPIDAGVNVDFPIIYAHNILPAWACRGDDNDVFASFYQSETGFFTGTTDELEITPTWMHIHNAPSTLGELFIATPNYVFTGDDIYLGNTGCANSNETWCFVYYIGEMTFRLRLAADRTAWAAQYDAAPV